MSDVKAAVLLVIGTTFVSMTLFGACIYAFWHWTQTAGVFNQWLPLVVLTWIAAFATWHAAPWLYMRTVDRRETGR